MTERFTLLTELGRGGMGVVWKARDEETGRIVALKLLREAYAEDPDYLARFERELELAKRIHSAHVVEVLGYGVRNGAPYLALEFIDGPTLHASLAAHGPYSWPETNALLVQMAQGLADAHAAGVVHRDIKPANVLIDAAGTAKITDFGIAKGIGLTRMTATSTMLGTPTYLAPEGPIDERSDLYSLGIVAYEMLTGAAPFTGTTYQEVIVRHIREAPDMGKLPPEARAILASLLAKDPAQRPQRASALMPVLYGAMYAPAAQPAAPPVAPPMAPPRAQNPFPPASSGFVQEKQWNATRPRPASIRQAGGYQSAHRFSSPTGRMNIVRDEHAAAILPDGSVLIVGGSDGGYLSTAELYDPRTGTFRRIGRMDDPRVDHTATTLFDGFVLISGGYCATGPLDTVEFYDPQRRSFGRAGSMNTARAGHSATLLMDGSVLVAGGRSDSATFHSAELFDPAANRFVPVKPMVARRAHHSATLLSDGRVLISGGCNGPQALSSAEVFDPATRSFSPVGSMSWARDCHTATALPDGRILVAGGQDGVDEVPLSSAELFVPGPDSFVLAGSMKASRTHHTATLMPNGRVLLAGGRDQSTCLSLAETFDPESDGFRVSGYMIAPRQEHTATLLLDGLVLLTGGLGGTPSATDAEVCLI